MNTCSTPRGVCLAHTPLDRPGVVGYNQHNKGITVTIIIHRDGVQVRVTFDRVTTAMEYATRWARKYGIMNVEVV
jgi:hypothetical protein